MQEIKFKIFLIIVLPKGPIDLILILEDILNVFFSGELLGKIMCTSCKAAKLFANSINTLLPPPVLNDGVINKNFTVFSEV